MTIANRIADMAGIPAFVDGVAQAAGVDPDCADSMNIVLDELLNNAISYGYAEGAPGRIEVALAAFDGRFCAEVTDDAAFFDPTAAPPDMPAAGGLARAIGGLGLHFVHSLATDITFERRDELNITTLYIRSTQHAVQKGEHNGLSGHLG